LALGDVLESVLALGREGLQNPCGFRLLVFVVFHFSVSGEVLGLLGEVLASF
jgi:hypothetical protein